MKNFGLKLISAVSATGATLLLFSLLASLITVRQIIPKVSVVRFSLPASRSQQATSTVSEKTSSSTLAPLSPSVTTRGKLYDPHSSIKVPEVQLQGAVKKIGELRPELATLAVVGTPGGDLPLEIVAGTELVALRTPPPSYPSVAERRGIEGSVTIQIEIDTEGAVANAQVTHSSRPGIFEEAALRAIRRWRFRPVIRNDKPTRVKALQSIVFRLKR